MTGIWKALGANTRKVKQRDLVHRSVEKRMRVSKNKKKKYKPEGFPKKPNYWPAAES